MRRTKELQEIKEILYQMKKEILQDLEDKLKSSDVSDQREIGDIFDDADLEQSREFNLLLSARDRNKIKQIESAMLRIEAGEFGNCEDCEDPIPIGRLKVLPFATLCVKCKSKQESNEAAQSPLAAEKV